MIPRIAVLLQIAFRNLFSSWINVIIGGLILVGTMFVLVGSSLLDSLDGAMSRSIIGSVAGHVQVYSANSKDKLSLYGGFGGEADLAPIGDFKKLKAALDSIDNVKTVVPMGINYALITSGNSVDLALARLRELYNRRQADGASADLNAQIGTQRRHVRQMATVLKGEIEKAFAMIDERSVDPRDIETLKTTSAPAFWDGFATDPFGTLEFLENRLAPLVTDADMLYLRYVGTDLDAFGQTFDRLRIVDGQPVPKGQRGLLLSKFFYEEQVKLKSARRLDKIREALTESRKSIATDTTLQRLVKENQAQTREIVLQLDDVKTAQAVERLQKTLNSTQSDLTLLLEALFATDDSNFEARYRFFYEQLAPMIELYRVRVGEVMTIKSFARSGYVTAVNVKIYGTFEFEGLEKSPLAGGMSLIDLMSFRDLQGYASAETAKEVEALKARAGVVDVSRASAEAELFGSERSIVGEAESDAIDDSAELPQRARRLKDDELFKRVYSTDEIDDGAVLNAAIVLKDPRRLKQTVHEIRALAEEQGLAIKALTWQEASGLLGQMVFALKAALYFAVTIIFVIAMVIINNAMMMATMQRTQTIGTLRAIGAQRSFVLNMVMTETLILGLLFGLIGTVLGAGVMAALERRGIPAFNDIVYFFFSGPRLHPSMGAPNVVAAFGIILLVSAVSTLIPAAVATRVSPVTAMQADE